MSQENSAKAAVGMSTAAAVAGIMAWVESRRRVAAGNGEPGEIVIPEELMVLIAAIAATSDNILQYLQQLAEDPNLTVKGWPPNTTRIRTTVVTCVAANTAYTPDTLMVPDGMSLLVRSDPFNPPASIVRVATNQFEALSPDMSYPLLPGETISIHIKDAGEVHVSSTAAGAVVIFTTEQES